MNQNIVIGILAILIILGGGYWLLSTTGAPATSPTATTTVVTTQNPVSTTPTTSTAGSPMVVTNSNVAPTNSTAVMTGNVTPNGSPTTYWYEYGASASLGSKTASQAIGSGFTTIPSPGYITGLSANSTYYFRLSAQNAYGAVSGTTYSFSTNNNPPAQGTPPAASTNAAASVARTSATLNAHVNPHSAQTTYWFEYGNTANFGNVTAFQSAGSGNASASVSAPISGLDPLTTYYFRVNAQNEYGTVNGGTQSFTTTGPAVSVVPAVTTQLASPVATTTATIRGTVNPYHIQTTYWFEYSTDSGFGSGVLTTSHKSAGAGTATVSIEANLTGLQSGTTYYFRTVAQNSAGTVRGDGLSFTTN
jgi:phosphodiesterase/alkaline phosphatase D-like protein